MTRGRVRVGPAPRRSRHVGRSPMTTVRVAADPAHAPRRRRSIRRGRCRTRVGGVVLGHVVGRTSHWARRALRLPVRVVGEVVGRRSGRPGLGGVAAAGGLGDQTSTKPHGRHAPRSHGDPVRRTRLAGSCAQRRATRRVVAEPGDDGGVGPSPARSVRTTTPSLPMVVRIPSPRPLVTTPSRPCSRTNRTMRAWWVPSGRCRAGRPSRRGARSTRRRRRLGRRPPAIVWARPSPPPTVPSAWW